MTPNTLQQKSPSEIQNYISALKKETRHLEMMIFLLICSFIYLPLKCILYLVTLIKFIFPLNMLPDSGKRAIVVPLPKRVEIFHAPDSFRPISLLSKVYEHALFNHLR